ncbi:peptidyl-prolyl cis-trans isomerase-like 6 [Mytilus galloprovincialis]|uniref:Peptidyl-prolyl cis-trans isomerase-like 6 n=1 Tax=Mytilus galloprovincialis TaxID=29158 RepID=A0A8B6E5K7_MYTGA|nr:peptidyl-prolyl cis-trans isomerase-like 6 [Mytilus galloprovincialis]
MAGIVPQKLEVYGLINDVNFQRARYCAEDLWKKDPNTFPDPVVNGMLEFEWDLFIDAKRKDLRGETWSFEEKAICFTNGQLIGGPDNFVVWAEDNYGFEEFRPLPLYLTLTDEAYISHLNSKNHQYVFMDVSIGGESAGRLVIELFSDVVPRTCENFKALCTGSMGKSKETDYNLHYKNSMFHRIVRNGWIQGGDIFFTGSGQDIYHSRGNGGESIYGAAFEDENFAVSHDRRGIVGMANKDRHTNGSQFYITLQPAKWMDTKYVAFGQVIEGTKTLKMMEEQETMNQRPMKEVRILDCGVCKYEF